MTSKNGTPRDRGSADYWYKRPADPHHWPEGTYNGTRIEQSDMTEKQIAAYMSGYRDAESNGDQKS